MILFLIVFLSLSFNQWLLLVTKETILVLSHKPRGILPQLKKNESKTNEWANGRKFIFCTFFYGVFLVPFLWCVIYIVLHNFILRPVK